MHAGLDCSVNPSKQELFLKNSTSETRKYSHSGSSAHYRVNDRILKFRSYNTLYEVVTLIRNEVLINISNPNDSGVDDHMWDFRFDDLKLIQKRPSVHVAVTLPIGKLSGRTNIMTVDPVLGLHRTM